MTVNYSMNAISLNRVLNTSIASIPHSESIRRVPQTADPAPPSGSDGGSPARGSDVVDISPEALRRSRESAKSAGKTNRNELTNEEKKQVRELQKQDRKTRAHEQAHLGAAGGLARGGASFSFTKGPDGRLYATGGEVSIDTSPVPGDPDATIRKADTIRRAALAPAEPSSQDKAVAAQAAKMANEARIEKLKKQRKTSMAPTEQTAQTGLKEKFDPSQESGKLLDLVA